MLNEFTIEISLKERMNELKLKPEMGIQGKGDLF